MIYLGNIRYRAVMPEYILITYLGGELGGDGAGETVDSGRISDVLSPVLNRSLASGDSLDVVSEHGEHSKTAVLDFLNLEFSEGVRVVSKAKRVEGASRVDGVEAFSSRSAVHVGDDGGGLVGRVLLMVTSGM